MLEIDCLVCGRGIKIPDYIDADSYDGQVSCRECESLFHVKLVDAKVRKYEVVDRKDKPSAPSSTSAPGATLPQPAATDNEVESIARYNPLRDFLASYRANQIHLAFEQIEAIIGTGLPLEAYTLKTWWDNNRRYPQALGWLEAGWEVVDVNLQQRGIVLRRAEA